MIEGISAPQPGPDHGTDASYEFLGGAEPERSHRGPIASDAPSGSEREDHPVKPPFMESEPIGTKDGPTASRRDISLV